jgi:predicted phage-related endonuclease
MSQLDEAIARLNAALDRLEETAVPLAERSATAQNAKVKELVKERDVLLGRLATLEDKARSLSSRNEDIETRLDGAIGEIRAALGR